MKKTYISELLLLVLLLCACNGQGQTGMPEAVLETKQENGIEREIYADPESGITISVAASEGHGYTIAKEDAAGYIDTEIGWKDIRDVRVTAWGENSPFLAIVIADEQSEYLAVFDRETLGEIRLANPFETVRNYMKTQTSEDGNTMLLTCAEQQFQLQAQDQKALQILAESLQSSKDISFHTDNQEIYAEIPITISSQDLLGTFRLYYEFDGVGLQCISADFVVSPDHDQLETISGN